MKNIFIKILGIVGIFCWSWILYEPIFEWNTYIYGQHIGSYLDSQDVEVDRSLEGTWSYLSMLLIEDDIFIDYSKIESIREVDLSLSDDKGSFNTENGRIYIDDDVSLGRVELFVLAHEVAHSQGMKHSDLNLLTRDSYEFGDVYFLEQVELNELIIETFKSLK